MEIFVFSNGFFFVFEMEWWTQSFFHVNFSSVVRIAEFISIAMSMVLSDAIFFRFYEWKKDGSKKQPYYIHFKDARPLVFAALFDSWKNPEGELPSFLGWLIVWVTSRNH